MAVPSPMPVISRGVPAYTNDDFGGSFPASRANDSQYSTLWRCITTPTSNADSGTLTQAVYLAYDLSGVSSTQRGNVVVAIYNDPQTGAYDYTQVSAIPNNLMASYTIDANAAAGGSLPGSGWTTLATVSGSVYHSRQHAVSLSGYNWVRIRVTAIFGSPSNNNVALNMDVHDAHLANQDNWLMLGDSICLQAFIHSDTTVPAQINALKSSYFPLMEDGGIGGWLSTTAQPFLSTWLGITSAHYVGLLYGTNDANNASPGDINFGPAFTTAMTQMITAIIGAGKIPVIPATICWGKTTNIQANGPTINTRIAALFATYPQIVRGPDLWSYFQAHQSLITDNDVHPTLPAGYAAYQALWVNSLVRNVYSSGQTVFSSKRHQNIAFV